ncbi:MAG: hypothetical protein ACP5XB_04670 [Isosphaeraceae bacterium]
MVKQAQGVIHGKTIELDQDMGIADGERVDVQLRVSSPARPWGEGILRSAGIAAQVPGFDEAFEQIQQDRQLARMRDIEE